MASPNTETTRTSNLSCSICSEAYKSNDEVLCTICGHVFHKACFQEWHTRSQTCPECRGERPTTQAIFLHIEDAEEAERMSAEARLEFVNKISTLERRLEESEQHFFDTQCALTFSDEQLEELKNQLEYANTINSSYEQTQAQFEDALAREKSALALSKEQVEELKNQVEYLNAIRSSYEEDQKQMSETLAATKHALSESQKRADELRMELEYEKVLNASHEQEERPTRETLQKVELALLLSQAEVRKLNEQLAFNNTKMISQEQMLKKSEKNFADILEQVSKNNCNNNNNNEEEVQIKTLKMEYEKKITDLLQQHAVAESVSEQIHEVLKNQLKMHEDQITKLKQSIQKLKTEKTDKSQEKVEHQNQCAAEQFKDHKSENEILLEEKIRRLEAKLKNLNLELESEIDISTRLTVENMKLRSNIDSTKKQNEKEEEFTNGCEAECLQDDNFDSVFDN